jgi:hypothetical protein
MGIGPDEGAGVVMAAGVVTVDTAVPEGLTWARTEAATVEVGLDAFPGRKISFSGERGTRGWRSFAGVSTSSELTLTMLREAWLYSTGLLIVLALVPSD